MPQVEGVIVACDGGGDSRVKSNIVNGGKQHEVINANLS